MRPLQETPENTVSWRKRLLGSNETPATKYISIKPQKK
jgi:hypothetical protein